MEQEFINGLDLVKKKVIYWVQTFFEKLPELVVASIIMFAFYYLAKFSKNLSKRLLGKVTANGTILNIISLSVYYLVLFEGLFISLNMLGLDDIVSQFLAGAGIIGLGLSFAFQSIATNIISGIIIAVQRPLNVGDLISTNGEVGVVKAIELRVVHLQTFTGEDILIPSKQIIENPLTNYNLSKGRRLKLDVGVSYGEDLEFVEKITLEAISTIEGLDKNKLPFLVYNSFADSSINFELFLWLSTNDQDHYLKVQSKSIVAIKKAYDANNITIPFPIRTLDFGIKGGKQLDEVKMNGMG